MKSKKKFGFIAGPSGIGKDYGVGRVLKEYYGVKVFVTGDWCRDNAAELANNGILAPDDIIHRAVLADFVQHQDWHYLVDAPRSIEQVNNFIRMFQDVDANAEIHCFHICGTRKSCEDRLVHRAIQQNRLDDALPEVIERRLSTYFKKGGIRDGVIPHLKEKTHYHHIDGNIDLEVVRQMIRVKYGPEVFGKSLKH